MEQFIIFYAPFIMVFISIVLSFWAALKDGLVAGDDGETEKK